jgi:ABC-type Na+ transport system ATPase subunit NatA
MTVFLIMFQIQRYFLYPSLHLEVLIASMIVFILSIQTLCCFLSLFSHNANHAKLFFRYGLGLSAAISSTLLKVYRMATDSGYAKNAKVVPSVRWAFVFNPIHSFLDILAIHERNFKGDSRSMSFQYILTLTLEGLFFFSVTLLLDHMYYNPRWSRFKDRLFRREYVFHSFAQSSSVDLDVQKEKEDLRNRIDKNSILQVKGISKTFFGLKSPVVAVKDLWFSVQKGQVFGLLGTNGAGKTTTLEMLCCGLAASSGSIEFLGEDVLKDVSRVRRMIGYCQQFDPQFENLTVLEHLTFYARAKGFPENLVYELSRLVMDYIGLDEFADRLASTLSGGNKRKLSFACALICDPLYLFLDEPSTGIDPLNRL